MSKNPGPPDWLFPVALVGGLGLAVYGIYRAITRKPGQPS